MSRLTLFWFRRDLRVQDNVGFYHALKNAEQVLPIFIFDTAIIDKLPQQDARIEFILKALGDINDAMKRQQMYRWYVSWGTQGYYNSIA